MDKPISISSPRQRGLALVTAMLVVAIAATIAVYLGLDQQIWQRQAENLIDRSQADVVRAGAEDWAITILVKDAKDSQTDDLKEDWAQKLPLLPVEGGMVTGRIADAQGRFNLNNLVQGGAPNQPNVALFRQLLQSLALDPNLVDAAIDWIDSDSNVQATGAEDIDYLQLSVPYRAANQPLQSVEELRLIKGFTPEVVDKLRPWVTALPQPTAINVNTADKTVLGALFYTLPATAIDQFIQQRPYTDQAKMMAKLNEVAAGVRLPDNLPPYGLQSSFFVVTVETLFGRTQRTTQTLIQRAPGADGINALWHSQRLFATSSLTEEPAEENSATPGGGTI